MTDRKHPRESVTGVFLMMEIEANFLTRNDEVWLRSNRQWLGPQDYLNEFWFKIGGSKEEFLNSLGKMSDDGCSQDLLNHIKYAREKGARWLLINNRKKP